MTAYLSGVVASKSRPRLCAHGENWQVCQAADGYVHATIGVELMRRAVAGVRSCYTAKHGETGKEMDIPFVHVWTVEDGEITSFQQYTDTLAHTAVMTTDPE